jgi:hypothetical protein
VFFELKKKAAYPAVGFQSSATQRRHEEYAMKKTTTATRRKPVAADSAIIDPEVVAFRAQFS